MRLTMTTLIISLLYNIAAIEQTSLNNLNIPKLIRNILKPLNLAFSLTKISLTNFNYQLKADLSQFNIAFVEQDIYKAITQDHLYKPAKTTVIVKDSTTLNFKSITVVDQQYLSSLLQDIEQHLFIDKVYLTTNFHGQTTKAFIARFKDLEKIIGIQIERVPVPDARAVKYSTQFKITHKPSGSSVDLFFNPINKDYNNTKLAFNPSSGLKAVSCVLNAIGSNDKALYAKSILNCNVTRIDYAFDAETIVNRLPFKLANTRICKVFMDRHFNVETIQFGETGVFSKVYNKYNELAEKGLLKAKDVDYKSEISRFEVTVLPQKTSKIKSCLLNDLADDIEPFADIKFYDEYRLKELLTDADYSLYKALGMFVLTQNKLEISDAEYKRLNRQLRQCEIKYSNVANKVARRLLNKLVKNLLAAGGSHVK